MGEILKFMWENNPIVFAIIVVMVVAIPLTVLVVVCQKQIGELILRRFTSPDNSDRPKENTQPTEQSLPDTKNNLKDVDEELHFDPRLQMVLAEQEQNIWAGIKEKYPKKYPEQRDDSLIKWLVKELTIIKVRADFEVLYGLIFGSQLRLLRKINERGSSVLYNEIQAYFLEVQKEFPNFYKDDKTDNYLLFLLHNSLIIQQGESYDITIRGVEFLAWMSQVRKNEIRYW